MRYLFRAAATAVALASASLALSVRGEPLGTPQAVTASLTKYDPEAAPPRRINHPPLLPPVSLPLFPDPEPIDRVEQFRQALREFYAQNSAFEEELLYPQSAPVTLPLLREIDVPSIEAVDNLFFHYAPDGWLESDQPLYDRDVNRARDDARHILIAPLREKWQRLTRQHYQHEAEFGWVSRQSVEPFYHDGLGVEFGHRLDHDASRRRQRVRIRVQDANDASIRYYIGNHQWLAYAGGGIDDNVPVWNFGFRVLLDNPRPAIPPPQPQPTVASTSLEQIARR